MATFRYLADVTTLELDPERCTGCRMCTAVCPHAVLEIVEQRARIVDRDACMECGACARNCEARAISVQSGVGCAEALINQALGRQGACCCGPGDDGASSGCC
jgi:NAD-dependent dihydropyrimidine dehydrogenase PreA subunit